MKLKKKLAVLLCVLLAFSVCVTIVSATAPDLDPRSSVSTMDIVEAYSKSTSLKGIRDDSWSKKITVTGYDGSDHEQYCTIRVGFDDGIFSNAVLLRDATRSTCASMTSSTKRSISLITNAHSLLLPVSLCGWSFAC